MDKRSQPSSKKQRQLIAIACAHFCIDKQEKQGLLSARFGKSSTLELTYKQAEELIDDFVKKGFPVSSKKRPYFKRKKTIPGAHGHKKKSNIVVLATPSEKSKIDALAGLIQWRAENGMQRWMEKRFGIQKVITSEEAFQIIEGLKGMFNNQMKKKYGPNWYLQDHHSDPEICRYIAEHFPPANPKVTLSQGVIHVI